MRERGSLSPFLVAFGVLGLAAAVVAWQWPRGAGGEEAGIHTEDHAHGHGQECKHEHVRMEKLDVTRAFTFHPERGETCDIRYELPEPALVTIKVQKMGTRELYLATIVNSEHRDAGAHTEPWDGRDYSGNIIDMSKATILAGADRPKRDPGTMPLEDLSAEEIVHGHEEGHFHDAHHRWAEEVPWLKILSPGKEGRLTGIVPIRCEVDKERRGYGDKYGYGVRYYVDHVLAHEEFYKPESDGKFAYELDTTAFADGPHMLYVGMCDHNEHASSAGIPVVFDNAPQ